MMDLTPRDSDDPIVRYISPYTELNAGLWSLFAAATVFLSLRVWCKVNERHGLWYDDHILIASWVSPVLYSRPHIALLYETPGLILV